MKIVNDKLKDIYTQYKGGLIISGSKDTNLIVKFNYSLSWIWLVIIVFNIVTACMILDTAQNSVVYIVWGCFLILSIYLFLKNRYTCYFECDRIIFKNKLNKKLVFYFSDFPRFHTDYYVTKYYLDKRFNDKIETYDFYIKLGDNKFDISNIGANKIKLILDNLEMKSLNEFNDYEIERSNTGEERTFNEYVKLLETKKRIVGVKDKNLEMKIYGNLKLLKLGIICVLIAVALMLLSIFIDSTNLLVGVNKIDFSNFIMNIFSLLLCASFVFFIMSFDERIYKIKISYPDEYSIKINKFLFDYKNESVMINIEKHSLRSRIKDIEYVMIISSDNSSEYIGVKKCQLEKVLEFLDNLVFENK